jgi:hypothetical protein
VAVLALTLILAPAFVVAASLVARRFGPRVGGLVGGLPVVCGPILLVLAIVHDDAFAARAASASLLGLVSLSAFVLTYGALARRAPWPPALAASWAAFLALTALFALLTAAVHVPPTAGLAAAFASFLAVRAVLPHATREAGATAPAAPPSWDLPVRALCAAATVLTITAASSGLGPRVSGLLAPAPVITAVLAAFTQAQAGADATLRLLRGMLTGFFSFALFCWTVAVLLPHAATGVAFAVAAAVAVLTQVAIAGGGSIRSRPYAH